MNVTLNTSLKDLTLIAYDTETSGAYPLDSELCEVAAIKWRNGDVIDTFQTLIRPSHKMSDFIIGIHGITNEMVENAPEAKSIMPKFRQFIGEGVLIAHHAPFDMGFLAYEFEKLGLMFPQTPGLCTSLLARKLFPESKNHKLQTLVEFFSLEKGTAHRALDDSSACLQVALKCFEKFGMEKTFDDVLKLQATRLEWPQFSLYKLQESHVGNTIVSAILKKQNVEISYRSKNDHRVVKPIGVVRNPEGDYLVAQEGTQPEQKRFYFTRIIDAKSVSG